MLLLSISSFCVAEQIFVSVAGDDESEGSFEKPLRTLYIAAKKSQPGDTVYIREGEYRETLAPTRSGEAGKPIIFSRYKNEKVVINAEHRRQGIMLWGVSYITVRGLHVTGANRAGIHLHHAMDSPSRSASHIVIENNNVYENQSHGIYMAGMHNVVKGNSVSNNGRQDPEGRAKGHGVYVLGEHQSVIGNRVESNYRLGIRITGSNQKVQNNLVRKNGEHGIGVWIDGGQTGENITIADNWIKHNERGEIVIDGAGKGSKPDNLSIKNNRIEDSEGEGLVLRNGLGLVRVEGNTFEGFFENYLFIDSQSGRLATSGLNSFRGSGSFKYYGQRYESLDHLQRRTGLESGSTHSTVVSSLSGGI